MTNFAVLFSASGPTSHAEHASHAMALSIISYVGCAISLVGLFLTLLTYSLFRFVNNFFREIIHLRKQPTSLDTTSGFPAKWRQRNERRSSILMTRHYSDLFSTSDWSCREGIFLQPIRSTTQIWIVIRHQYGISALAPPSSFRGETIGGVASMRYLFLWHATHVLVKLPLALPYYLYLEAKTANNEIWCGFSCCSSVAFLSLRGRFSLLPCWHKFCRRKMFDMRLKLWEFPRYLRKVCLRFLRSVFQLSKVVHKRHGTEKWKR